MTTKVGSKRFRDVESEIKLKKQRKSDLAIHNLVNNFDLLFPERTFFSEEKEDNGETNCYHDNEKKKKHDNALEFPIINPKEELDRFRKDPRLFHVKDYKLAEIHGCVQQGVAAACVPFPDHNAGPRISYATHHMKATIGMPERERESKTAYQLWYPERPLVGTAMTDILGLHRVPAGINCMTAITCYYEANEEDSLLLKKEAIEMGMFMSMRHNQCHTSESNQGTSNKIGKVPLNECIGVKKADYSQLEDNGVIRIGAKVHPDSILVQQTTPLKPHPSKSGIARPQTIQQNRKYKDTSLQMNSWDSGTVNRVLINKKEDGSKSVTINIHRLHRPEEGDKFATRHGQKGIAGRIVSTIDLPFDDDGISPDVIINALAFISRQTYSQMFEGLLGSIAAITGKCGDATPFSVRFRECFGRFMQTKLEEAEEGDLEQDKANLLQEIEEVLLKLGLNPTGCKTMYSGITGLPLKGQIFHTPIYTLALKHQACSKIRARARGRYDICSRQPNGGRKNHGGLKLGEMEKDAILAHGATSMTQDRMLYSSDFTYRHICQKCQYPCIYSDYQRKTTFCNRCMEKNTGLCVPSSHSFKVWGDEVTACGMAFRYNVEQENEQGVLSQWKNPNKKRKTQE